MRAVDELNQTYHQLWRKSGWTRARIARELGVNYTSVYRWESGETTPEASKLLLLAQLIGEPVQIGGVTTVPTPPMGRIDETEMALLAELRKVPQPIRSEMLSSLTRLVRVASGIGAHADPPPEPKPPAGRMLSPREANLIRHMRGQATPEAEPTAAATEPAPAAPAPRVPRRRLPVR